MGYQYFIRDLEGTLYYSDTPVIEFVIKDRELKYSKELSHGRYYPAEFDFMGINYDSINHFFAERVVRYGAQEIEDYLDFLELDQYDFEKIVKKMNGWNALDNYWLKFNSTGAKNWSEIQKQHYPIC